MKCRATIFFILSSFQFFGQDAYFKNLVANSSEIVQKVFQNPEKYRLQIIYTEIKRDAKNTPIFTTHRFRSDVNEYFYPASTVKLAACVLGLEKINSLKNKGLSKESHMIHLKSRESQTSAAFDSSTKEGRPSLANYIKKILLVSDNDAYNRIYEWLGQKEFNEQMAKKGFKGVRFTHRLQIPLSPEENRFTNAVQFYNETGKLIWEENPKENQEVIKSDEPILLGKGVMNEKGLVDQHPLDFTYKNAFPLEEQHDLIKRIFFPESFPKSKRLQLTSEDYVFLRKYMSMFPTESEEPNYSKDPNMYPAYCKFLYYGGDKQEKIDSSITIYNKVGDAYGFLLDNAYIVDQKNQKEHLISVTLLCNEDEIFNDDHYDYETIGFPFMKELGKLLLSNP